MAFVHIHALWLLVLAGAALVLSLRDDRTPNRRVVAVLRAASLAAVILAISRPLLRHDDTSARTIAVVDVSASITDESLESTATDIAARRRRSPHDNWSLVRFARTAEQMKDVPTPGAGGWRMVSPSSPPGDATSIAAGLQLAGALAGDSGTRKILLYTDGYETHGDAAGEAVRLAERGIAIEVVRRSPRILHDVVVHSLTVPPVLRRGEAANLRVLVESRIETSARIRAVIEPALEARAVTVRLKRGRQWLDVPFTPAGSGLKRLAARIEGINIGDGEWSTATFVGGPLQVLVAESDGQRPAAAALSRLLGIAAEVHPVESAELTNPAILNGADVLVLANAHADDLTPTAQETIESAVTRGLGCLVSAGPNSLGPGGYAEIPLARVLPVRMPSDAQKIDPSTTLAVIIDTSGSMQGPRIALAKEVVRLAMRRLEPHDKVGIVEFYGSKRWAAPIQSAGNLVDLNRAINRLTAGGGTLIYPAIEEAFFAIKNVNTRSRHVLILTDGGVESGAFEPLVRRMAENGIAVSTVLVGPAQHSDFLMSLSQWGRGRYYHAPDQLNLPEVLLKQPQNRVLPPFVEEPAGVVPANSERWITGLDWQAAPLLRGYVRATARPASEVLLKTTKGDPLLARWNVGAGSVAVLTTQLGSAWSGDLSRSPSMSPMISGLLRSMAARPPGDRLDVLPTARAAGLELDIRSAGDAVAATLSPVRITLKDAASHVVQERLADPLSPGHWNELFQDLPSGDYAIEAAALGSAERGVCAAAVREAAELRGLEPDEEFFARLQAGIDVGNSHPRNLAYTQYTETWPALASLGALLLLVQVLLRRLPHTPAMRTSVALAPFVLAWIAMPSLSRAAVPESRPTTRAWTADALQPGHIQQTIKDALQAEGSLARLRTQVAVLADADAAVLPSLVAVASQDGDLAGAMNAADRLARVRPNDADAWRQLGELQDATAHDDGAVASFERSLKLTTTLEARRRLQTSLAVMLFDTGRDAQAIATLRDLVHEAGVADVAARSFAARIALLKGHADLGAELMSDIPVGSLTHADALLKGHCQLRSKNWDAARASFELAATLARSPRERRFAAERVIAAARAAGTLDSLATQWINDPQLPADRLHPLFQVLRELHHVDTIERLLRTVPASDAHAAVLRSAAVQQEVVSSFIEAGRPGDAEALCRELVKADPANDQWLLGVIRSRLHADDVRGADAALNDAVLKSPTAARASQLAELAASLGRYDVAHASCSRAVALDPASGVETLLFQAQLRQRQGQPIAAVQLLADAARQAESDDRRLSAVAEAYERLGDRTRAIALFEGIVKRNPSKTNAGSRLAWLLEQENRLPEAREAWGKCWRGADSEAGRRQARTRFIELSAKTGVLADLAADMETRLAAGQADANDIAALVEIYTSVRDAAAAAEVLHTAGRQAHNEIPMLRQLADLYRRCEQFGLANQVLRELVQRDPAHALDTLQEIAVLALERGKPRDARWAVAQIVARAGMQGDTWELTAGVLDRLGLHAEAAREYRRGLAANPLRGEDWLLWANSMSEANQKPQALGRLQILVQSSDDSDLFGAAADGLLNLQAPRNNLRVALRTSMQRIAATPEKLVLYQVAADAAEAAGDRVSQLLLQDLCLLVAGEQRTSLLRELIANARAAGRTDLASEYGSMLVALGDEVPPQALLELGQFLLCEHLATDAARAFSRAAESDDSDTVRRQVADAYERAGEARRALEVMRDLARLHPDELAVQVRTAGLEEQLGEHDAAASRYADALDMLLRREMVTRSRSTATSQPIADGRVARRRPAGATTTDEFQQFSEAITDGLVASARSKTAREAAVTSAERSAHDSLARAGTTHGSIAEYPQLSKASAALRRVAFALHQPDRADAFDRDLVSRFPTDVELRRIVVQERLTWGLIHRAVALAGDGVDVARSISPEASRRPARMKAPAGGDDRLQPIARLLAAGKTDQARSALKAVAADASRTAEVRSPLLYALCLALDLPEVADQATIAWLQLPPEAAARAQDDEIGSRLRICWGALSDQGRANLLDLCLRLARESEEATRPALALNAIRISRALGKSLPDTTELLREAVKSPSLSGAVLAELTAGRPSTDRMDLLASATTAAPAARRRSLLLQWLVMQDRPIDASETDAIVRLFADAPPGRGGENRQTSLPAGWNRHPAQLKTALAIADLLLKESPTDTETMIAAAQTFQAAGQQTRADALSTQVLSQLISATSPARGGLHQMADAVGLLSASGVEEMLRSPSPASDAAPVVHWVRGLLLQKAGRESEALRCLVAAFRAAPENMEVRRGLIEVLETTHRYADLLELFGAAGALDGANRIYERTRAIRAALSLGRFDLARRLQDPDGGFLGQLQRVQVACLAGDGDTALAELRSLLIQNRLEHRHFAPYLLPIDSVGGMAELAAVRNTDSPQRVSAYEALGHKPFAADEFQSLLDAAVPGDSDCQALIQGLLTAASDPSVRERLLAELQRRQNGDAITVLDRALLVELATTAPMPASLVSELDVVIEMGEIDRGESLSALALAYQQQGRPERAEHLDRLAGAIHAVSSGGPNRFAPRRASSSVRAPAQTRPAGEHLPEVADDRLEAARIDGVSMASGSALARSQLEALFAAGRASVTTHPGLAALRASLAAEAGDFDVFRTHLADFRGVVARRYPQEHPDIQTWLPSRVADKADVARIVEIVTRFLDAEYAAGRTSLPQFARLLCLMGKWSAELGDLEEARRLLAKAHNIAREQGEPWLWLADLARIAGRAELAVELEASLLRARSLPTGRLAALLAETERLHGPESAAALRQPASRPAEPNERSR